MVPFGDMFIITFCMKLRSVQFYEQVVEIHSLIPQPNERNLVKIYVIIWP